MKLDDKGLNLIDVTFEDYKLIREYAKLLFWHRSSGISLEPHSVSKELEVLWKAFRPRFPHSGHSEFALWALLGKKKDPSFNGILDGIQSTGKATYDAVTDVFGIGLSKISWQALESLRNAGRKQMLPEKPLVIAIDIGGVISKHPDVFRRLFTMAALPMVSAYVKLLVMTDMSKDKAVRMLADNNIPVAAENVYSADYDKHGESCKAELCKNLGVDVLIDDHAAYVSVPGAPAIRLFLEPDASQPYYHPTWITRDGDGRFGRVVATKREVKHDGASKPKTDCKPIDDEWIKKWCGVSSGVFCGERIPDAALKWSGQ